MLKRRLFLEFDFGPNQNAFQCLLDCILRDVGISELNFQIWEKRGNRNKNCKVRKTREIEMKE